MIPKKIHYCWFGGNPLPDVSIRCIESWKKYAPDCQIIQWNEQNYDVKKCQYVKEAYERKKYAFVSDVARLEIIYNEGGIYLDTDVELIRSIDDLFLMSAYMGQQTEVNNHFFVNTGLGFGAEKGNAIIKEMLEDYNDITFVNSDGSLNMLSCPTINSKILYRHGLSDAEELQKIDTLTIFPPEYFCPMNANTYELNITKNTYSIHHFAATWVSTNKKVKRKIKKLLGSNFTSWYKKMKEKH